MTDSKKCIFEDILNCSEGDDKLFSDKPLTEKRKSTIINSSKERADSFGTSLVNRHSDELQYHTNCYASYTSKSKIEKYLKTAKRKSEQSSSSPLTGSASKRLRSR